MKRSTGIVHAAMVLGLSCVWGCAAWRAGQLSPVSPWPPSPAASKPSISVALSGQAIVNGSEQEVNSRFLDIWREQALKAYQDSGLFSSVATGLGDTDLRAEVKVLDRGDANLALALLSGFTMTMIPSRTTDEFIVRTAIKDRGGNTLGTFEKQEAISTWIQLFMVFAMPGNFPGSVAKQTLYDLNRATINEARAKKVL